MILSFTSLPHPSVIARSFATYLNLLFLYIAHCKILCFFNSNFLVVEMISKEQSSKTMIIENAAKIKFRFMHLLLFVFHQQSKGNFRCVSIPRNNSYLFLSLKTLNICIVAKSILTSKSTEKAI